MTGTAGLGLGRITTSLFMKCNLRKTHETKLETVGQRWLKTTEGAAS